MGVPVRSYTRSQPPPTELIRSVKTAVIRGSRPAEVLASAANAIGLLETIESIRVLLGVSPDTLRIAVKLDLAYPVDTKVGRAIVVVPEVSVAMAEMLAAAGYRNTHFVESRIAVRGAPAEPLTKLAKRHGYPVDFAERLIDLVDDSVELDLGSTVGKELVGRTWVDADVRIILGKNRTHTRHLLWGTFGALLGCYAREDRFRVLTRGRRAPALSAVLLNARLPANFAFLDAWVSGDGAAGNLSPGHPNATSAILASTEPLAVDWLAGELMGLDPGLSPFLREAMFRNGVLHLERIGNLTPWTPWKNVSLLRAAFAQVTDEPRTSGGPELPG